MENIEYLKRFYNKIYNNLKITNKLKENSIIVSFFYITTNTAFRLLNESSIHSLNISEEAMKYLLSHNYIRAIGKDNRYMITAKGVWKIELDDNKMNSNTLIESIDKKYFKSLFQEFKISDKEKVVLLTMIVTRSFSNDFSLDLFSGKEELEIIKELITDSYAILKEHKVVKNLKEKDLFGTRPSNEAQVTNVLRHAAEKLVKKTNGLYMNLGKQRYYLNLYRDSHILKKDIIYLMSLIYENKMTENMLKDIIDFCKVKAHKKAIFLYGYRELMFISPYYDDFIEDSLKEFFFENGILEEN